MTEVNTTKYNESSTMEEILRPIVLGVVLDAIQCEPIRRGRRLIRGAQKEEFRLISLHDKTSEMQKRWQKRGLINTDDVCIPYEITNQLVFEILIFDCLNGHQNPGFKCPLITVYASIARLDESSISVQEGNDVRRKVKSGLDEATSSGVLKDLFYS